MEAGKGTQRAVLLDRDGTLVYPRHYPSRPQELQLYPGVVSELNRLQSAGFSLVVVTNQGGLAHGYFDVAALEAMHTYLREQLLLEGVQIDGIYYCPHHPAGVVPELAIECQCRKPRPGMILQAASDLDLDLSQSWFIGDILDDVEAGRRAGCRTILVDLGTEPMPQSDGRTPDFVARNTVDALQLVAVEAGCGGDVDRTYRPERWSELVAGGA